MTAIFATAHLPNWMASNLPVIKFKSAKAVKEYPAEVAGQFSTQL